MSNGGRRGFGLLQKRMWFEEVRYSRLLVRCLQRHRAHVSKNCTKLQVPHKPWCYDLERNVCKMKVIGP